MSDGPAVPVVTRDDVIAAVRAEARQSVARYLNRVWIDSTPPSRWAETIAPFQLQMVGEMAPAVESAEGLRDDYTGNRRFWWTLPRGHDKTGFLGRLVSHALCFAKHPVKVVAAAGDKDQARLLTDSMRREQALNPWVPLDVKKYDAEGPTGRLEILSSDAPTSSGILADLIVCDELTYWRHRQLWDMVVSGAGKRPNCVVVVITNAGIRGTWQWDVRELARTDPAWTFREAPPRTCLATWIDPKQRASDRKFLTPSHAERVYDNIWTNASDTSLLELAEIEACAYPVSETLWRSEGEAAKTPPSSWLYVGVDVGRTRDLTVITTSELTGATGPWGVEGRQVIVRELVELHGVPFEEQTVAIERAAARRGVRAGRIDRGGIGYQLAEHFERARPGIWKGVSCSDSWQGQAALKVSRRFRSRTIRIPNQPVLIADLQQVDEVGNSAGGLPILRTHRTAIGHADRFWSLALCIDPMPTDAEGGKGTPKPTGTAAAKGRGAASGTRLSRKLPTRPPKRK